MWKVGDTTNAWFNPNGKDSRGNVWSLKGLSAARIEADKVTETQQYVRDMGIVVAESQVTNLVGDLSTLTTNVAGKAALVHTHAKADISATGTWAVADIPTLTLTKISDAGTAAAKTAGNAVGNVPMVEAGGTLNPAIVPAVSTGRPPYVVASQAAMLAVAGAQVGDIANRTDLGTSFMLQALPASTLANWVQLAVPGVVTSVLGLTGAVTFNTGNIAEGSNLYYTTARAQTDAPAVTLSAAVDAIFSLSGQQFTLDAQTANTVLRGGAVPAFGALVSGDIPTLSDSKITFDTVRAAHLVHVGPTSGSAPPTWRLLDQSDIPTGIPQANIVTLVADLAGKASATRQINTTAPLAGGGNLTSDLTLSFGTKAANVVFAGPSGGGAVAPDFRALVTADLPTVTDNLISYSTTRAANTALMGPTSGGASPPGWRAFVAADIPAIPESGVTNLTTDLAAKAPAVQFAVVSAGTITTNYTADLATGGTFNVTAGAATVTINAPTNAVDSKKVLWKFRQDATGNRAIVLSTAAGGFSFTTDIPSYTASTAPNALDHVATVYDSVKGKHIVVSVIKGA
jgi:hypothetical protein